MPVNFNEIISEDGTLIEPYHNLIFLCQKYVWVSIENKFESESVSALKNRMDTFLKRYLESENEQLQLDKTTVFNPSTDEGVVNQMRWKITKYLLEILLEYTVMINDIDDKKKTIKRLAEITDSLDVEMKAYFKSSTLRLKFAKNLPEDKPELSLRGIHNLNNIFEVDKRFDEKHPVICNPEYYNFTEWLISLNRNAIKNVFFPVILI